MELLIFILGVVAGWNLNSWRIMRRIIEDPDKMLKAIERVKELQQEVKELNRSTSGREIRIEKHGDMLYLFAKDTDEFLAQGKSLQEALDVVETRYPDQTFQGKISKEEADSLGIKA